MDQTMVSPSSVSESELMLNRPGRSGSQFPGQSPKVPALTSNFGAVTSGMIGRLMRFQLSVSGMGRTGCTRKVLMVL